MPRCWNFVQVEGQRADVQQAQAKRAVLSKLDKTRADQEARAEALGREADLEEDQACVSLTKSPHPPFLHALGPRDASKSLTQPTNMYVCSSLQWRLLQKDLRRCKPLKCACSKACVNCQRLWVLAASRS